MPLQDLSDVRAVKEQLHPLHGMPTRFRQRLFHCGNPVDDATPLDAAMELGLVLLSYHACSETKAEELATASANGSVSEVRS